jgi:3-phosphoshikimate 1-carboxyvinyltransferase
MKTIISPGNISGTVEAPASKSYLQRAIAIAALAKGSSQIKGCSKSKDADAAIEIIQALGAQVSLEKDILTVVGIENFKPNLVLQCGEAGLSARMFSPIAALSNQTVLVIGEGSLLLRPMNMVEDALLQCGLSVETNEGKLPLIISGKLNPSELRIDGSESSQLLTGLLIALSAVDGTSKIEVENLKSIPYISMTLDLMNFLGLNVKHTDFKEFVVEGNSQISPFNYHVEGDWSGAAFHLVAAAIAGQVSISNLNPQSLQADAAILDVLRQCGSIIQITENNITVKKAELNPFEIDITNCPDLFPILAVLAVSCTGISRISGIHRLKNKESDRLFSVQNEFAKLGISTKVQGDHIYISQSEIQGGKVESHADHRIAMAMAVLALKANSPIEIDGIEAADKSYPSFFQVFGQLRVNKELINI